MKPKKKIKKSSTKLTKKATTPSEIIERPHQENSSVNKFRVLLSIVIRGAIFLFTVFVVWWFFSIVSQYFENRSNSKIESLSEDVAYDVAHQVFNQQFELNIAEYENSIEANTDLLSIQGSVISEGQNEVKKIKDALNNTNSCISQNKLYQECLEEYIKKVENYTSCVNKRVDDSFSSIKRYLGCTTTSTFCLSPTSPSSCFEPLNLCNKPRC